MKTLVSSLVLVTSMLLAGLFSNTVWAQRTSATTEFGYSKINSAQEVIQRWSPETRLFVKGDIGVSAARLSDLTNWLATNGPHWTVVLMSDAEGESFLAADRRTYFGMDAVEFALGKGLTNQTAFGQLVHPTTDETDGAIFVLFLKERKFSYFSSEAQDRRGLGRTHWIGELDQPAFRAMRSGGRIVDAVKDTVKSINQRLDRAIREEKESAQQAELERLRDFQSASESLAHLKELISQVDEAKQALRERQPGAQGELANPPLDAWRDEIQRIESTLNTENASQNQQRLKQLGSEMDAYLNGYAALEGYDSNRKELQDVVVELSQAPNQVARSQVREIEQLLQSADTKVRNGDMDVTQTLREADKQVTEGRNAIAKERARIEQEQARWRLVRQVLAGVAGALALLFCGALVALNRMRKPTMDRAETMLKDREVSISKETDGLDALFSQSADLLGSRERIEQRGYTGATRDLSLGAINDIDDLLIMNKEIRRVIEQARGLMNPKGAWESIVATFSRQPFEDSINKLSGAPLKFTRATGIPLILMDIVRQKAKDTGQPEPEEVPDEVVLTFDEIYQAIQSRRQRAAQAIQTLEQSLIQVNDKLDQVQSDLQRALDQDARLSNAASNDGLLDAPSYFDVLIPSAQSDLKEAETLSSTDAVTAIEGPIQRAQRKLGDAKRLADAMEAFRLEQLPEMISLSEKLREMGYPTPWMESELQQRSQWANQMLERAAQQSIASQIDTWQESMQQLMATAREAMALAIRIRDDAAPKIETLKQEIQNARRELGRSLSLPPEQLLVEPNLNPDDLVVMAQRNLEAASTMLRQGKTQACREALEGCDAEVTQANETIHASHEASREFGSRIGTEQERLQNALTRVENLWGQLQYAEQQYTSEALRLAYSHSAPTQSDSGAPSAEPAIDRDSHQAPQLIDRARERADACRSILTSAQEWYRQGKLLSSMGRVQEAAALVTQMDIRLDRVEEHLQRLEKTVVENEQWMTNCVTSMEQLLDARRDRMVTVPTLDQIEAVANQTEQVQRQYTGSRNRSNPFEFANRLVALHKRISELEGMVVSDRHGYAEAQRALEGAVQQWQVANQFVKQAQADSIPDSPATTEGVRRVDLLERNLLNIQHDFAQDHGDWRAISSRSASIQSDLSSASNQLNRELQQANQTLEAFQQASQMVYDAEHWTGPWGIRVQDSAGVRSLEAARAALQRGQYTSALEASRRAYNEAHTAVQRAEREVAARRMEEQQQEERRRRKRMAAEAARYGGVVIGPIGGSGPSIFGPGGFGGGGGGGFGGGGGGGFGGGGGSGSDDSSGFSRSGW